MPLSNFDADLTDGTTTGQDIGPAIVDAVRYAQANGSATLIIPPGDWELRTNVDVDLDTDENGNEVTCHFKIVGQGPTVSKIVSKVWRFPAQDRIRIDVSKRNSTLEISDLGFLAQGSGMNDGTYLLRSRSTRRGGQMHRTAVIRNVYVGGYDDFYGLSQDGEYFANLFDLSCHNRPLVENVVVASGNHENVFETGADNTGDWSDDSELWTIVNGIVLDGAYAPEVNQCVISRAKYPIICRGNIPQNETSPISFTYDPNDTGGQPEIGVFTNNRFPTCIIGIVWHRDGAEPGFSARANFIDFRDYGVYVKGAAMGEILLNNFVQKTVDEEDYVNRANPKDIYLDHVIGMFIEDNYFQGPNPARLEPEGSSADPLRIAIDMHNDDPSSYATTDVIVGRNYVANAAILQYYCRKMADTGELYYKDPVVAGAATIGGLLQEGAAAVKHTPYL